MDCLVLTLAAAPAPGRGSASVIAFEIALAAVAVLLVATEFILRRRFGTVGGHRVELQLVRVAVILVGVLLVIVFVPVEPQVRGQILTVLGIILSAIIGLSSTTFVGNAMAGIMVRVVRSFRVGDFVHVGEHFGRVTEIGLLHTELQTEDRDLTTMPNLLMVTSPVRVVRSSGTIIHGDVSLGYDCDPQAVQKALEQAARDAELEEPFVLITALGDFSIAWRVGGLLREVKTLISARSRLHAAMLTRLHEAEIEIVSPNFMNTRMVEPGKVFIPEADRRGRQAVPEVDSGPEEIAFDKAEAAEDISRREHELLELEAKVKELEAMIAAEESAERRSELEREQERARERVEGLKELLKSIHEARK